MIYDQFNLKDLIETDCGNSNEARKIIVTSFL